MARAKDILGSAGAGGFGGLPSPRPILAGGDTAGEKKNTKKPVASKGPRTGQQRGGGKGPVGRRPKV